MGRAYSEWPGLLCAFGPNFAGRLVLPARTGVAGYAATPDNRGEDDLYLIERDLTTSHYEVIESSSDAG